MMIRFLVSVMLVLSVALAQGTKANLTYTSTDMGVSGPTAIAASGFQNFSFINNSKLEMDFTLAKLRQGTTLAAFIAADKAVSAAMNSDKGGGAKMAKYIGLADVLGGVHFGPNSKSSAYIRLEPGTFVLIASSGGGPGETYKPFYQQIKVTQGEMGAAPKEAFTLRMMDFHFDFPQTMPAGERLWKVSNMGSQPHFALIFKLAKGKTAKDVIGWMESGNAGPPPVEDAVIVQGITGGQTFYTPINLTPGTYVALCPLPNLANDKPHFADGMVSTFTVK